MNPLASRYLDRPLALAPQFVRHLGPALLAQPYEVSLSIGGDREPGNVPYDLISGVAIIPVHGVLVHSESWMSEFLGEMSYRRISAAFSSAMANPDVRAIAFHIESPGGDVDGAFELADQIYEARGTKPMVAITDPYAYSAAYAIASAADQIAVPATGGTGSVGVIALHMEMSDALKQQGIGVTVIAYGDQKAERGPFAPLTPDARERMQDDVDMLGEMFVGVVARNRGMSRKSVKATQASTYLGATGVEVGFADAVLSPQAAFATVLSSLKRKRVGK